MNEAILKELKSLPNPPVAVKDLLKAIAILLGEELPNHPIEEWKRVKKVLGAVGDNSVTKRLPALDLSTIPPENLQQARDLLSPYSFEIMIKQSHAAGICYKACMDKLDLAPSTGENKTE